LHLKPVPKWLVILALIMVTLSALVLASTSATVQDDTDTKHKTEDLFSLLQKANVTVVEIFRQFEADGKTIPQASLNEYNQALILAEESRSLLQAGNYSEADSKIVQALQKFKEALRIVYTTIPEQPTETETALERTAQLKSSINRYSEQLQRIENLTRFTAAVGYNTTALEAKIQTVKALLDKALSNIDQKRFEAASVNLADAKALIDSLVNALNNIAVNLKIQRLQTYIAQTEVRLATIKETAISLSNTASLTALNNAETSLENAKEYLEKQQINETLSELANSRASEEEAVEYLKPTASSSNLTSSSRPNAVQVP
jgi:tetratricopeptide (TPR) repeat protein